MGTDIHLIVEAKWSFQTEWEPINLGERELELLVWRDYNVFRKLVSGVRENGECTPISDPRGLPTDCHEKTRDAFGDSDYHSISWISSGEFKHAFPWRQFEDMEHFALVGYSHLWQKGQQIRFIFGFDS